MLIYPEFQKEIQSKNLVHLVRSTKEITSLDLSKKEEKYVMSKLEDGNSCIVNSFGNVVAVFKFGKLTDSKDREAIRKFGDQVYNAVSAECKDLQVEGSSAEAVELLLEGISLSSYKFDKYLSDKKTAKLKAIYTSNAKVKIDQLIHVIDATCWARTLVNEPVSYLTAAKLSEEIINKCKDTGIKVEVFEKAKIESLKMGGLLAVNKGSIDPPTFNILEYKPAKAKNKKPIVLVGKGIVYDTGGLSLKPTANSMDLMKSDMAGAAAMAATIYAVAKLNLPLHIVTLIPATDNRPGGAAYAPGDVITMFNGTTVEVLNTDAEGRMVLADALSYSDKYKPELVIDAATLTGAAIRAIGEYATCMMGNAPQEEMDLLADAGFFTHDRVVQMPFWDEYKVEMKSKIADLKNLGGPNAGQITAGKFLEHFVSNPYVHLDIAGPSFTTAKDSYRGLGGTGSGVRLLVEYFKRKAK
ncbi:MAG: leucyl aminopeptidase family protein [Crocinitomicaceae bacterium]|nr:leucyl aminopeptidase family protein [Crocinitomicaceae bacterium]